MKTKFPTETIINIKTSGVFFIVKLKQKICMIFPCRYPVETFLSQRVWYILYSVSLGRSRQFSLPFLIPYSVGYFSWCMECSSVLFCQIYKFFPLAHLETLPSWEPPSCLVSWFRIGWRPIPMLFKQVLFIDSN